MMVRWSLLVSLAMLAAQAVLVAAQEAPAQTVAAVPEFAPRDDSVAVQRSEFRTLDEDVQDLKKQVLDLNRDLSCSRKSCCSRRIRRQPCSSRWTSASSSGSIPSS